MVALRDDNDRFPFLGIKLVWPFCLEVILHNGIYSAKPSGMLFPVLRVVTYGCLGFRALPADMADTGGESSGGEANDDWDGWLEIGVCALNSSDRLTNTGETD